MHYRFSVCPSHEPSSISMLQLCPPSPLFASSLIQQYIEFSASNRGHGICFCNATGSQIIKADLPHHVSNKHSTLNDFVSALKQCKSLHQGKHLHAQITQSGYGGNVFLGNCLIEMYGECGSLADAQDAFDRIQHPNIFSWNLLVKVYAQIGSLVDAKMTFWKMPTHDVISWSTMITACARRGETQEALDLYNLMESDDVQPNDVTFLSVLDVCTTLSDVRKGQSIHSAIVDCGYDHDVILDTALVNMYGKCGNLSCAMRTFHSMQERDVVAWNAIILSCSDNHNSFKALQLYDQMHLYGVLPTKITYLCVMDACNCNAYLNKAHEIHSSSVEQGFEQDMAVGTALTQMYGKCGSLQSAKAAFSQVSQRTVISWNTMIAACTENGDGKEALRFFHQMHLEAIIPNEITFASILDACSASLALEEGKQIHSLICSCNLDDNQVIGNALINMYGSCGRLLDARKMFEKLECKNLISWTAMMTAFAENGQGHKSLDLFEQMKLNGIEPDIVTFLSALDACVCTTALGVGTSIHVTLVDIGYEWNLVLRTALISMYAKCGSIDDARRTFSRTSKRDVVCWNTMLAACAQNGYHNETLEFFNNMQLEGTKPDKVTFFYVLIACIHTGKVDEGRQHFYSMVEKHGLEQMGEHIYCMVDLLSRAGHFQEAEALIATISADKRESSLLSLLNACMIHREQAITTSAAEQIFNLDLESASSYVSLSNIYAMNKRYEGSQMASVK